VLVSAVTCIVLFTTWGGTEYEWGSPTIVGLAVGALVLVPVLLVIERRAAEPVVPIHLFSMRTFSLASSTSFIIGVAMFGGISFLPLFLQVVTGASATNSGMLLVPLMLGLLSASVVSGRIISRTGRYKVFPVAGTAIAASALVLLSTMGTSTTQPTVMGYMVLLGIGIGCTMQTLILATQNAVPIKDLGTATAAVTFFRSMGGSIGVAFFGALFNSGITSRLDGLSISVGEGSSFTPDALRALPPETAQQVSAAFAEALTNVFLYATPLVLVAFGLTWLLRETPLRSSTHAVDHGRELAAGSAPGTAEPEVAGTVD
jgi:predicted MFS family arabinose efflux permease